ncbi:F-box protein FBW2-like [Magnolia sinica]|uniref:F-box protein FBW2-like n=1 Tax=Magnolia sinica TaxID=86752 RepID=UPI002658FE59|nr:F-box protein FBW2-like [Magnolia sinica]
MDYRTHNVCWDSLFEEVLIEIFSKLDFHSLISVASVCHSWRCVAHYPECWEYVRFCHHERFVNYHIKETVISDLQYGLFRESEYMIKHVGAGAKSIWVHPLADDTMVQRIADRSPSIESISLRNYYRISTSALINLIQACKLLKFIDITFCSSISVSASLIEEIGLSCPGLVGINFGNINMTEEIATAIGKFMPKLNWLNLNGANISCEDLCMILDSCTELDYVSVKSCHRLIMKEELKNRATRIAEFYYSHALQFQSVPMPMPAICWPSQSVPIAMPAIGWPSQSMPMPMPAIGWPSQSMPHYYAGNRLG